ncbi:MAG TPA: nucleotide exchange factor GrpE [Gammaproteobacteria bacterium]|nr:nucleotide exchange factor GrpE [Gammaproteobacteria bacterium]
MEHMNDEQTKPAAAPEVDPNAATLDPVQALQAALAVAEAKASQNYDSYLRAVAEQDNIRKRGQRDLEQAHKFGQDRLLGDLLPVKDSLEMALQSLAGKPEAASLLTGVDMTLKLLATALERQGVKEVSPAKGEAFNPEFHEAMATQESAEVPADAVLTTVQKGYVLNGRLLRPARVLVARAPKSA